MAGIFGRLTIRSLLGGLVGMIGLFLSLMCGINLVNAWQRYEAGERVAELSMSDKALLEAMQALRFERVSIGTALAASGELSETLKKRVGGSRASLDAQLAIALPILDKATVPDLPAVRDKLKADYQDIKELRARVDSALEQPSEARNRDLLQSFMPKSESLLQGMENNATTVESEMRLFDPALGELALLRRMAWSARSSLGAKAFFLVGALTKRQGLSAAEQSAIKVSEGRAAVAWELVRDIVMREGAAPELKVAYDNGQSAYFGAANIQRLDAIVRSLSAGEIPQLSIDDLLVEMKGPLEATGNVAVVAADLIRSRAKEIADYAEKMVVLFGSVLILALAFAFGGFLLIQSRVSRPITVIAEIMRRLSANDLGVKIPGTDRDDEIGQMANAVLVFKDNMIETERLRSEQAGTERRMAEQRKSEMQKLANEFQAAVGNIVERVSMTSTQLEAAANTLNKTAETTQQLLTSVGAASEQASANVNSVASASEQLAASVNEVGRQVQGSSKIAGEAVSQAQKTDARIAQLSQAAGRIGDVVKLITSVAEQTNLLALNATIEAARAGDAGKGFAVVAHEVKALAAQTAKATDEIGAQIAGMQTATQDSVAAIKEIGGTIGRMSDIAAAIAATVEQQGATTQEISRNVQQAARGTAAVASSITSVNRGASETGSASTQVLSAAQSLSHESTHLKVEVEKFLSKVRAA